jgi:hypothetical protein
MEKIELGKNLNRIFFPCKIQNNEYSVLFDPGSPNTIITLALAQSLGLKAVGEKASVKIAGGTIPVVPVILPEISFGNITITDVKVLAGLNVKTWRRTIILGLNVLNYFKYTIDREKDHGYIEMSLNNKSAPEGSERGRFNHLLGNDGYYVVDKIQ